MKVLVSKEAHHYLRVLWAGDYNKPRLLALLSLAS